MMWASWLKLILSPIHATQPLRHKQRWWSWQSHLFILKDGRTLFFLLIFRKWLKKLFPMDCQRDGGLLTFSLTFNPLWRRPTGYLSRIISLLTSWHMLWPNLPFLILVIFISLQTIWIVYLLDIYAIEIAGCDFSV